MTDPKSVVACGSNAEIEMGFGVFVFIFSALIAVGVEVVAYGIRKHKFWGWIAGLIVYGRYLPSLFLPLGVLGLWGFLTEGSRVEFGLGSVGAQPT